MAAALMSLVEAEGLALPGRLHASDLRLVGGTLTALVGPNGSGKTSLLHALARIGDPAGRVRIAGHDVDVLPPSERVRLLSFLPASRDLPWPIPAGDLIALSGADRAQVAAAIERLELAPFAARRADRLSTGERSRVLLARAMACESSLLLLDEPIANLDPLWQMRSMELLRAEVAHGGRAALVAMHDLDAAARYADRLIVMHDGRIAAADAPAAVLASRVIKDVFGIEAGPLGWRPISPGAGRRSLQ